MELTPHIKALFDDMLTLTSKIVVKRPDIANSGNNETSTLNLELFAAYRDIVNGEESVSSYNTIPRKVLDKIVSWTEVEKSSMFSKVPAGAGYLEHSDGTKQIYDYRMPTPADQVLPGTLWVHKVGRERYAEIFSSTGTGWTPASGSLSDGDNTYNINEELHDINGKPCHVYINELFIDTDETRPTVDKYGNTITWTTTKTYRKDEETGAYVVASTTIHGEALYYYGISYGFKYDEPQVIPDESETYIEYSQRDSLVYMYNIIGGPYFLIDGEYIRITDIPADELESHKNDTAYYRVIAVSKCTDKAYIDTAEATDLEVTLTVTGGADSTVSSEYYFVEDEAGSYVMDGDNYILADEDSEDLYRYAKVEAKPGIDKYSYSNGVYISDPNGDYTYICDSCIYYIAQKVTNTTNKAAVITMLDKSFWPAVMERMHEYVLEEYCPTVNPDEHRVPLYIGEANPYYRMLNGLPELNKTENSHKIDRFLLTPEYTGTNTNPYVYELTDGEVERMKELGLLDDLIAKYPNDQYLQYLGNDRIDVIEARDAKPFEILRIADVENDTHIDFFKKAYAKCKDYVLHRFYNPEIFQEFDHYVSYIGFLIMAYTICTCISQSDDILVYDKYLDDKTINNILDSNGFTGIFSELPTIYRKMLAKNIGMLIKYRGTDDIYKIIYKILGITDFNVYNYEIVKTGSDIEIIKRSIYDSNDINEDVSFADMIQNDPLWKANEEVVSDLGFTRSSSKYVDMETYFDLGELTLNNSFMLNYLADVSKNKDVTLDIPDLGIYKLYDLVAALFAIQSIKFGYTGTIPMTAASSAAIYKFNLSQANTGDNEARTILETYRPQLIGTARENVNHLLAMLDKNGSVYLPGKNDTTVRSFAAGYFSSMQKDSPGTNLNENSFYQEVLELRSKTKNMTEYKCYSELLDCIATAAITADNFSLKEPIWEPIFAGTYTGSLSSSYNKNKYTTSKWAYGEDLSILYPNIINPKNLVDEEVTEVELDDNVFVYVSEGLPNTADSMIDINNTSFYLRVVPSSTSGSYDVQLYQKCFYALTYNMYMREHCPELYSKLYSIGVDDTYVINIYDTIFSFNASFIKVTKENGVTIVDLGDETNYTLIDSDDDGDIDIIHLQDGRTITTEEYYQILKKNADRIYKMIIAKIESSLSTDQVRKNLVLSHESTVNLVDYLKLLINIFKSYNVEIRDCDVIYKLDNNNDNAFRVFDNYYFDLYFHKKEECHIYDTIEILEEE